LSHFKDPVFRYFYQRQELSDPTTDDTYVCLQ